MPRKPEDHSARHALKKTEGEACLDPRPEDVRARLAFPRAYLLHVGTGAGKVVTVHEVKDSRWSGHAGRCIIL